MTSIKQFKRYNFSCVLSVDPFSSNEYGIARLTLSNTKDTKEN